MKKFNHYFTALKKFIRKRWKLVLIVIGVLGLGAYWFLQSQAQEQETLTFEQPQREELIKTLDISGKVDAEEKARLRFLTGGKILYLGAKEGDWVNRWQTIARIDSSTLLKQQNKDLNNYLIERWDWENTQDGIKDQTLDEAEHRAVEQEQFRLNNTVLDVEIRNIAIRENALYAPFTGVLTTSPADVSGMQLSPTDYFELVNPDTLIFRAAIDEADIADVQVGQKATIELDAYTEQSFDTEVSYISYTSSESSTGTVFLVKLPFNNPDIETLRLGMNGDVRIVLDSKENVLTIPLIATRERDGRVFVDIQTSDNEYEEREIKLGLETEDKVEVIEGLSEEDFVLIPE